MRDRNLVSVVEEGYLDLDMLDRCAAAVAGALEVADVVADTEGPVGYIESLGTRTIECVDGSEC